MTSVKVTESQVLDIVRKHALDPTHEITRDSKIEDSGIDSYGLIEIVFELEEQLDIEIPYNANDSTFGEAQTVGDLMEKLLELVEKA